MKHKCVTIQIPQTKEQDGTTEDGDKHRDSAASSLESRSWTDDQMDGEVAGFARNL